MAPERLTAWISGAGSVAPDHRSDLYSLGLVLYEVLLGTPRFEAMMRNRVAKLPDTSPRPGSPDERDLWLRFHRDPHDPPAPRDLLSAVPEGLSRVVARLARKDPNDRYPTAVAALRDLFPNKGATGARPTAPAPPFPALPQPEGVAKPTPSWRGVWPRAATLAVVLTIASVGLAVLCNERGRWIHPGPSAPSFDTVESMVDALTDQIGPEDGPRLAPHGHGTTLRIGEPMRFRATPRRPGALILFILSQDGSVHRLYPRLGAPSFLVTGGDDLLLPLDDHQAIGFRLKAGGPAGPDRVFLLVFDEPGAKPPEGRPDLYRQIALYPFAGPESPAAQFVEWVVNRRRQAPDASGLAILDLDITP